MDKIKGIVLNALLAQFQKTTEGAQIGVSFHTDGVAVCVNQPTSNGPKVTHCASTSSHSSDNKTHLDLLQQLLNENDIPKGRANIVLSVEDHTIHKLARPAVEEEELNQSVKWMLKDRLSHGVDDAIIEVISYPEGCQFDDQIMAVEVSRKKIANYIKIVEDAGLELGAIDIAELVLGDLLQNYPGIEKGLALVLDHEEGATLLVYRGEYLYLIRKLTDIHDFISCLPTEGNMVMADALLLEVQRTLDYYDAQMRQPPLSGVLLAPSFADISTLAEYLDKNLSTNVECLNINHLLDLPQPLAPAEQKDCLSAAAGSFRTVNES